MTLSRQLDYLRMVLGLWIAQKEVGMTGDLLLLPNLVCSWTFLLDAGSLDHRIPLSAIRQLVSKAAIARSFWLSTEQDGMLSHNYTPRYTQHWFRDNKPGPRRLEFPSTLTKNGKDLLRAVDRTFLHFSIKHFRKSPSSQRIFILDWD